MVANYLPAIISGIMALFAMTVAVILQRNNVTVENATSASIVEQTKTENLLDQISVLNSELETTRHKITELYEQNYMLVQKLKIANDKISDLQDALDDNLSK